MFHRFSRIIAALLSGASMVLLFPPYDCGWLVWLVPVPLIWAISTLPEKRRRLRAFGLGWLMGVVGFLGALTWLRSVTDLGWVVLSCYLALFPALWACLMVVPMERVRKSRQLLGLAFRMGSVWCLLEWLRGWLFTGFGWDALGVAFHDNAVISQSADLLGAVALSFLPVFTAAVVVLVMLRPRGQRDYRPLVAPLALLSAAASYGIWRLNPSTGSTVPLKSLIVQLNIPQTATQMLWTPEQIHQGYEDQTLSALGEVVEREDMKPDWIIWPEASLSGRLMSMPDRWAMGSDNWNTISHVNDAGRFTYLLGLVEMEGEAIGEDQIGYKENGKIWNSLVVLPPDQKVQTFRKHHLVIFGEYIPFVDELPFLKKIYEEQAGVAYQGAFSVGQSLEPLKVQAGEHEISVIPSVCFEDTVPRLMRKFVREDGPQVIVNITNDGWFQQTQGAAQHFANARFRAIELRRPMLRSANTGVSAVISPTGSITTGDGQEKLIIQDKNGSSFTRGHLLTKIEVPVSPPRTLYAMIGDWGVIALGLLGFLVRGRKPL
jgi:apolipoprotein N-acyltransferase